MDHKVYQGEYSLSHWIDLLLSKNIVLPEYQRSFVWSKKKVEEYMNAIANNQYIPPVTIGMFQLDGKKINYILDGQQRLTSILLALFEKFPKKGKDAEDAVRLMNENDDIEEKILYDDVLKWNLNRLTELGDNYEEIKDRIQSDLYDVFHLDVSTGFYYNHYLAFNYIVPNTDDKMIQQKFYSSVFRSININSQSLSEFESRESLYFLDDNLKTFFTYKINDIVVKSATSKSPIDFVRYMACLSQYAKDNKVDNIAYGYGKGLGIERYYEEYIYEAVGDRSENQVFKPFDEIFPGKDFRERLSKLSSLVCALKYPKEFGSIIEADVYLFGLLYVRIVKNKAVDLSKKTDIEDELKKSIDVLKRDKAHLKSPAALKYLRERIKESIDIYSKYEISD